jgi:pre-mRNA-splicing factor ATP-dependent RNA helicase DHX38/PRP16
MLTSGVATRKTVDLDFEDESESTVHVMIHDIKPPFLDGRTVFTKQLDPINPIRDPTSDMAVFSKKGSALVKEKREQAERAKAAAKLASLGGTSLGNIMGVKDEEAEAEGAYCLMVLLNGYVKVGHSSSLCFLYVLLQPKLKHRRNKATRRITRATRSLLAI